MAILLVRMSFFHSFINPGELGWPSKPSCLRAGRNRTPAPSIPSITFVYSSVLFFHIFPTADGDVWLSQPGIWDNRSSAAGVFCSERPAWWKVSEHAKAKVEAIFVYAHLLRPARLVLCSIRCVCLLHGWERAERMVRIWKTNAPLLNNLQR